MEKVPPCGDSLNRSGAIRGTRHLVYELSSPSLRELGLEEAIAERLDEEIRPGGTGGARAESQSRMDVAISKG